MLRRPGRVGAVAPSSGALAKTMTRELSPDAGSVVELGGGTGMITNAILARGVAPEHLVVLETNPIFANLLRERFPAAQVLELDAQRIAEVPLEDVGTVISGLPMLAIPTPVQRRIVEGAFQLMRPGGVFVQFTYGWRAPIDREIRESLGLTWTVSHWVWRNVPPARVYRFRQASPATVT
jgi:phosphatidylethanolamine/phosphatidyl-N-methylethanolamine N-methyltransferase